MKRYIVQGQKVDPIKLEAAKNLRRAMTEAEALLWQALRRNQCGGCFTCQRWGKGGRQGGGGSGLRNGGSLHNDGLQ